MIAILAPISAVVILGGLFFVILQRDGSMEEAIWESIFVGVIMVSVGLMLIGGKNGKASIRNNR